MMQKTCRKLFRGVFIGFFVLLSVQLPAESEDSDHPGPDAGFRYLTEIQLTGPNMSSLEPFSHEGRHMIGRIAGGSATGPVLNGKLLPVGEDWALLRPDGTLEVEVQMLIRTEDDALVKVSWEGRWKGSKEVFDRILSGQDVSPDEYYLRVTPYFETQAPEYEWLNSIVAVGYGKVQRGVGVTMKIYAVN